MGTAILQGFLSRTKEQKIPSIEFTAWVRTPSSLFRLQSALGSDQDQVKCIYGSDIMETSADIVILAFPPDQLNDVVSNPAIAFVRQSKLVISLLAGVSCDQLSKALPPTFGESLFCVIPTNAAKINDSFTLISEPTGTTGAFHLQRRNLTAWLFSQLGEIQWLPESLMDEATATRAACNALTMVGVDAVIDASVAEGLPRYMAQRLAEASLRSALGLLLSGNKTPESLRESMSVLKGVTINSVLELEM